MGSSSSLYCATSGSVDDTLDDEVLFVVDYLLYYLYCYYLLYYCYYRNYHG